jgi:hypothetical protein
MSIVKKNGGVTKKDLNKHKNEIFESVILNCYLGGQNFIRDSEVISGVTLDCRHNIQNIRAVLLEIILHEASLESSFTSSNSH